MNIQELDTRSPIHEESPTLWKKPPIGMNKVNRDVVVEKTHGRIGIGIVMQDNEGVVLAAHSTTRNIFIEPAVAKALAAWHAADFSREMGFYDRILEGDALQSVNAIKGAGKNRSKIFF